MLDLSVLTAIQTLLMPGDLRECMPEADLEHFIMEAVGLIDLREANINERGTGSCLYSPALIVGGARQVGKTYLVQHCGAKNSESLVTADL